MRTEDQPEGRAFEALFALSLVAHPYRWPVIGWRSDIEATTVEACRTFFDQYYVPNNVVVVIVGDFDTAEALAAMRESFGPIPPAKEIPRNPTLEPEQREAFLLKHVEQLSYEEMVEITGAGISALKMRVKRACEQLREQLEGVHDA